ncbi:hypothetical protein BH10PSE9_BH10PSE9_23780 [soil metagenome]
MTQMTLNEFEIALGRYGGELARWPEAERGAAEALVAADPAAAKLLAQEQQVGSLLRRMHDESQAQAPIDSATLGRIIAGIDARARPQRPLRPTRRLAAFAGAAMAASLMIGYVAGVALPASDGEDTLAGLMFGSSSSAATDAEGVL